MSSPALPHASALEVEDAHDTPQPTKTAECERNIVEQGSPGTITSAGSSTTLGSSGGSLAINIELPAVNELDEKIKQLQKDREMLKTKRKQSRVS